MLKSIREYYGSAKNFMTVGFGGELTKRFLINSDWWRKWCDYVGFNISMISEDIPSTPFSKGYPFPGKIENDSLLVTSFGGSLKPNLLYEYNFIVVNSKIWKLLKSWYGSSVEIVRRI